MTADDAAGRKNAGTEIPNAPQKYSIDVELGKPAKKDTD